MPLQNGREFAGYTVIRLLGASGLDEVYLVNHPRLPRQIALKVLPASISSDAEFRARFEHEADLAASLSHPHIVGVRDRGEFEGRLWIAMDFVDGSDAAYLLRERFSQGMPVDEVLTVVSGVADALDYAHGRRLLHCGVKPASILLTETPDPKRRVLLKDFGISPNAGGGGLAATNITMDGVNYAAPEQLLAEDIDDRADQYALAATTYHLLTGTAPFAHLNPTVVISHHLNAPAPTLANTHPQLAGSDAVFARALAKNREDRYQSAGAYAAALTEALSEAPVSSNDATAPAMGFGETAVVPAPPSPGDSPTPQIPTPAAEAPPVFVSDWGAAQPNTTEAARAQVPPVAQLPPRPLVEPSREGPNAVLIGIAIAMAIALVAIVTFLVLQSVSGTSSTSAPLLTPTSARAYTSTVASGSPVASPPTPQVAPTPSAQQVDCGVDLHSPTVMLAVDEVEPGAAWPLDREHAWGNFDPCAPLSVALVPTAMGTGSSPVEALIFRRGQFIGTATPDGVGYLRFNEDLTTEDTVVLTFRTSIGSCGGCSDGTYADVRFQARNGVVVALDPIPKLMP